MNYLAIFGLVAVTSLSACDVQDGQYAVPNQGSTKVTTSATPTVTQPADVQIFTGTPSRAYTVLGPLDITVNKLTALNKDPTQEAATARLQQAAAKLGADAVINVSVGEVKVSLTSWGTRQATGTAVKF